MIIIDTCCVYLSCYYAEREEGKEKKRREGRCVEHLLVFAEIRLKLWPG